MKTIIAFILSALLINNSFAGATGDVLGGAAAGSAAGAVTSGAAQKAAGAVAPELTKSIGDFMGSPTGIMILAGIGTVNSATLYSAAAEQEKESAENIKKIERILASFKDSYANFCPNGREKLEEPNCYCYLENGQQNKNRSNSQICQQLWAKNKTIYDATPGVYAGDGKIDPAGCLMVNGQFDENCKCKQMLNSSGQNACMKTIALNVNGNPLGAGYVKASGFDKVMTNLAQTASGNPNLNRLNPMQLGMAIAKQNDLNNRLFAKLPAKKAAMLKSADQLEKYSNAVFTKKNLASMAGSGSLLAASTPSSAGNFSPDQMKLLKEASKKAGLDLSGGDGLGVKKDEKKEGMKFDFMDGSATAANGTVQDFPEKTYKYKNSDIQTDTGASIFEIISNRYTESGLRRLFETPEEAKAAAGE